MFFFRKRSQAFRKNTRIGLIKNILVTMVTNTSSIQSMTLNFLKSTRGRGKPSTHFSRGLLSHAARELGDSRRRDASASQACKLLGQRLRHEVVGNLLVCRRQFCSSEVVAAPHHILLICWNRAEVGRFFVPMPWFSLDVAFDFVECCGPTLGTFSLLARCLRIEPPSLMSCLADPGLSTLARVPLLADAFSSVLFTFFAGNRSEKRTG